MSQNTPEREAELQHHAVTRRAEAAATRERFMVGKKLNPYKLSEVNILKVLKTGVGSLEDCRRVARAINGNGRANFYDHAEIFGRDGQPLMLVGCPYTLDVSHDFLVFNALFEIGMKVRICAQSNYGHGTIQVEISA